MWRRNTTGDERRAFFETAASLMMNHVAFLAAMRRVLIEMPYACEVNFTAPGVNKRAWLGHAACYLATGSPEDVTRQAWWTLTQEQQDAGNAAADTAIAEWETRYIARLEGKDA